MKPFALIAAIAFVLLLVSTPAGGAVLFLLLPVGHRGVALVAATLIVCVVETPIIRRGAGLTLARALVAAMTVNALSAALGVTVLTAAVSLVVRMQESIGEYGVSFVLMVLLMPTSVLVATLVEMALLSRVFDRGRRWRFKLVLAMNLVSYVTVSLLTWAGAFDSLPGAPLRH